MPMEGVVSADVCTMILPTTLAPLLPIVKPLIVTVNGDEWLTTEPDIVMIVTIAVVALQTAERPGILLAPAVTMGITDGAKKLEG